MKIGFYGLLLTVLVAPLAIGGVRVDVQLALSVAVAATFILIAISNRRSCAPVSKVVFVPLGIACLTLLQLIPMPISWLSTLSPESAALYLEADPSLTWAPLTVDFIATMSAALHQLVFALVFIAFLLMGSESKKSIAWCIVLCGFLSSLIAIGHTVFGAHQIYGVYDALHRDVMTGFFGPFVNENTFASLLVLSAFVALGIALDGGNERRVKVVLLMATVCFISIFLTGSRGGHVATVLGVLTLAFLTFLLKDEHKTSLFVRMKTMSVFLGITLVSAFAIVAYFLSPWAEFSIGRLLDEPKVETWFALGPYLDRFGALGSGRGTFGHIYAQLQAMPINGTVSHAENFLIQSLAEFGLIFGVFVVFAGVAIWFMGLGRLRRRPRGLTAGAMAGLAAVGLQQCVDFGLESMGLSLAVASTLAIIFSERRQRERSRFTNLIFGGSILILGLVSLWGSEIIGTRGDGHLAQIRQATNPDRIHQMGTILAARHPADPMIPLVVAQRLSQSPSLVVSHALRWTNLALRRAPQRSEAYEVSANILLRAGREDQAAGEYRRAISSAPWRALSLNKIVAQRFSKPEHLLAAVPNTPLARQRIYEVLFQMGKLQTIIQMIEQTLLMNPNAKQTRLIKARACVKLADRNCLDTQAAWFRNQGFIDLASVIQARRAHLDNQRGRAITHLDSGLANGGETNEIFLRQAIKSYGALGAFERGRTCLDHLWEISRFDSNKALLVLRLQGWLEQQAGQLKPALAAYERALALRFQPDLVIKAANIEVEAGRITEGLERLSKALNAAPSHQGIRERKEQLKVLSRTKNIGND